MSSLDSALRPSIARRLSRWLTTEEDAPPPVNRWREHVMAEVSQFLTTHDLDPIPDHYALAYAVRFAANARLVEAIRAEIDANGTLDASAAERIFAETGGSLDAGALSDLAERVQSQAEGLTGIARRSGQEVRAFGSAIEAAGDTSSILELTRAMVAQAKANEAQLRSTQAELTGLREHLAEAQRVADVDPLTELPNRRAFKRTLEAAITEARAVGRPMALAFCDIDHFKSVNDSHGHETGDRVLRFVAGLLAKEFARGATVGRFGGEEFVILLESKGAAAARRAVDACRDKLSGRHLYAADGGTSIGYVTFSAGVTALGDTDASADLLRRADEALYRAKAGGRNRVLVG